MALDLSNLGDEVLAFLAERHLATLTTLRADGTPHVVPVGFGYDPEERVARIITFGTSQKVRNVGDGGRAVLAQVDGGRWLSLEGEARGDRRRRRRARRRCVRGALRAAGRERRPRGHRGVGDANDGARLGSFPRRIVLRVERRDSLEDRGPPRVAHWLTDRSELLAQVRELDVIAPGQARYQLVDRPAHLCILPRQ